LLIKERVEVVGLEISPVVAIGFVKGRDDDAVGELAARQRLLRLDAKVDVDELDEDLADAGHVLDAVERARDLQRAHDTVAVALLFDVLQDVLVLFVVLQLVGRHHVQQAQHLPGEIEQFRRKKQQIKSTLGVSRSTGAISKTTVEKRSK